MTPGSTLGSGDPSAKWGLFHWGAILKFWFLCLNSYRVAGLLEQLWRVTCCVSYKSRFKTQEPYAKLQLDSCVSRDGWSKTPSVMWSPVLNLMSVYPDSGHRHPSDSKLRKQLLSKRKNLRCPGIVEYRLNTQMWKQTDNRLKIWKQMHSMWGVRQWSLSRCLQTKHKSDSKHSEWRASAYNTSDRSQPSSSIHVALLPSAPLVLRSKVLKLPSWLPMAPFFLLLSLSKFFIVMLPLCELQKPSSSCENSLRKMPPDG